MRVFSDLQVYFYCDFNVIIFLLSRGVMVMLEGMGKNFCFAGILFYKLKSLK